MRVGSQADHIMQNSGREERNIGVGYRDDDAVPTTRIQLVVERENPGDFFTGTRETCRKRIKKASPQVSSAPT